MVLIIPKDCKRKKYTEEDIIMELIKLSPIFNQRAQ